MFIHHVYFWLKNSDSKDDLDQLKAGLQKLTVIETIGMHQIGVPAATNREVIDRSYSVSVTVPMRASAWSGAIAA